MFVQAYERAKKKDYERKMAKEGGYQLSKIHGIPFSIKDHINYKGVASHWGHFSKLFTKTKETNLAIQCLLNDGAIPFIKSATPFIPTLVCENPFSGEAKNPYNLKRTAGGSSGGEGGLVGSGCSPFGMGSDQAGSLRVPSSHCKLTTISLSIERIGFAGSNLGLLGKEQKIPDLPLPTTLGPMCKNVEDCISVVESWCSPERLAFFPQAMQVPLTALEVQKEKGKKYRIGYFIDDGYIRTCPAVRRTVLQAKQLLEQNGHTLIEFKLPDLKIYRQAMDKEIMKDQGKGFLAGLEPYEPTTQVAQKLSFILSQSKRTIRIFKFLLRNERDNLTPELTGQEILQNRIVLQEWKQQAQDILLSLKVDSFLSPVLQCVAPQTKTFQLGPPGTLPGIINFLGMTGSSVPFGRVTHDDVSQDYTDYKNDKLGRGMKEVIKGSQGLPIGVQISSFPGREAIVFSLMKELEHYASDLNNYFPDF